MGYPVHLLGSPDDRPLKPGLALLGGVGMTAAEWCRANGVEPKDYITESMDNVTRLYQVTAIGEATVLVRSAHIDGKFGTERVWPDTNCVCGTEYRTSFPCVYAKVSPSIAFTVISPHKALTDAPTLKPVRRGLWPRIMGRN